MTHPIYTADQLNQKTLTELKQIAASIGAEKPADARKKASWVEAILEAQPQLVETLDPLPNSKIIVTEWDTTTVAPVERKYEVSPQAKSWLKQKLIYQGSALGWFLIDSDGNALSNRYRRLIDAVAARYELINEAKAKKQPVTAPKVERTPREIKHLGEGIFKVVGDTGNTYLVEYLNGETQCQCEASKHGRDCYHARVVRAIAESFPNLQNQRLFAELSQAAQDAGYYLLTPDWLSFSAGIASDGARLGEIGCNGAGQWWVRWYAHGNSRKAESAADAMRILMVARGVVAV